MFIGRYAGAFVALDGISLCWIIVILRRAYSQEKALQRDKRIALYACINCSGFYHSCLRPMAVVSMAILPYVLFAYH
jgi:hypothetical protein